MIKLYTKYLTKVKRKEKKFTLSFLFLLYEVHIYFHTKNMGTYIDIWCVKKIDECCLRKTNRYITKIHIKNCLRIS